jgi:hypothetical protein
MAEIPHTSWPLRYVDGRPVLVEQDSPDHMEQRVAVTCLTPLGDALHDPTFGIDRQLMRLNEVDLDVLAAQIASSEPDIPVALSREQDGADGMALLGLTDDSIRLSVETES